MANPTTNYGFVLPTSTDLVTDLPADFDVALQGVDTQMLTNANAAIAKAIVDAKGDLIAATGADAVSRIAVGANGTVLQANSATATGLQWAILATGTTFSGCRVTQSAAQSIANGSNVTVNFNTETFDVDGYHDNVTNNNRLTVPTGKSGYFLIFAKINLTANATGGFQGVIRKNGSQVTTWGTKNNTGINGEPAISIVASGVPTDFFDFAIYQDSGISLDTVSGTTAITFGITYLGA